ncbi:MAG: pyruvate formate lyase-activating protein [Deltaproteobacteria bacterium]|nr:pyruvate formate lyase-activating protein [Deltaproteobacteria bacterium]
MAIPKKILAIDIGGGTQDILVYEEGKPMENCVQMILPSPTQIIAQQISQATAGRKNIFVTGNTMGGGPCSWAVENHLKSGLKVYATELAALTFHDNLDEVRRWGIKITNRPPKGAHAIHLRDVDLASLRKALRPFQVNLPETYAIAVQDHGFNPRGSNRRFRFQHWEKFLDSGGDLSELIYLNPPEYMTRMIAVQKDAPGAAVMDTCAAAIWGVLCDPRVAEKQEEGLIALNLGNQHTLGALIQGKRIWGIFEHHTANLTRQKLKSYLDRFPQKLLSNDEIFRDGGHGGAVDPNFTLKNGHPFIAVTGPRRSLAEGLGYHMAAPYGDMMLTGCFGLVAALKTKLATEGTENTEKSKKSNY